MFDLFNGFKYAPAIPFQEGVSRRDPSPVIEMDGTYYCWYSRSTNDSSGYGATIWYAVSSDGRTWVEQTEALPAGMKRTFDDHAVFTPTVLVADDRYYLYYTAVSEPFTNDNGGPNGNKTAIGVAESDRPEGPWRRTGDSPILAPTDDPGLFDSYRVDDACLLKRDDTFWLYYKGRQAGKSPTETKMGLAFATHPAGPFTRYDGNPVIESGHEVCVWPHGHGVAALMAPVGPDGSSLQFSDDGIHFSKIREVSPPSAPGPFREDRWREGPGDGITWGLCQDVHSHPDWPFLLRFDCDLGSTEH